MFMMMMMMIMSNVLPEIYSQRTYISCGGN